MSRFIRFPTGVFLWEVSSPVTMKLTTFLVFATPFIGLIQGAAAASGFGASCTNYFIENNNILRATCKNNAGGTTNSSINLNACIGIAATQLVCQPK